jgi:hypothetical protein
MKKYHLNASTLVWQHPIPPDDRPSLTQRSGVWVGDRGETKAVLKSENSVEIEGEMQIMANYFSLSSCGASGNCLDLYEQHLGVRDEDPRGSSFPDEVVAWAVNVMSDYAEKNGVVLDLNLYGHDTGKTPAPYRTWWMGYFDSPTPVDPSWEPERLMQAVESCLQVGISGRLEIAGVCIGNLHVNAGPGLLYRHCRATRIAEDPKAFDWVRRLQTEKQIEIFTNDSLAWYLYQKRRKEEGLRPLKKKMTDQDFEVILRHEVEMPENLEFRGVRQAYSGPTSYSGHIRPHPFVIGPQHFKSTGTGIDVSVPCAHCKLPMKEHTYNPAVMLAIKGSVRQKVLAGIAKQIEEKAKEIELAEPVMNLLDARTGKGADLKTQIISGDS